MTSLFSLLKQRTVQTVFVVGAYLLLAGLLPPVAHAIFYTTSIFIKDCLVWMMPITVAFFIAHTVSSFENKAPLFILSLVLFETISNFTTVWVSYSAAHTVVESISVIKSESLSTDFQTLWRLPFKRPAWWGADKGCFIGLIFGLTAAFFPIRSLSNGLKKGKKVMEILLTKGFARLIPLFVLGFVANLRETNLLQQIFSSYGSLTIALVSVLIAYILFLYVLSSGFHLSRMAQHIKNLLPAGGVALSSGCSLSTMPWTIEGASRNLKVPALASAIIPATTNIQQIGDCLANTFLCFMLHKQFFGVAPDPSMWLSFSIVFVMARFATAAVLGGAVFIMLPIYESYLNFTPEMTAIVLAFNVMLDPLITSSNVMANGALCRVFERFWLWIDAHITKGALLLKTNA